MTIVTTGRMKVNTMTNQERAAVQQALEALETLSSGDSYKTHNAATALREALAEQAEQEPVAWGRIGYAEDSAIIDCICPEEHARCVGNYSIPLYTHPVRTKDLTDDEIMKINVDTASIVPTCDRQFHFARAVIAADREKNRGS